MLSSHPDFEIAPFWLVLWHTVCVGGAFDSLRQHSLVSQQAGQGRINPANRQRHTPDCDVRMLPAHMGLIPHCCVFP